MRRHAIAILPLIFLGGAATQQSDCAASGTGRTILPALPDPTGKPTTPTGLSGQSVATVPGVEGIAGCGPTLPSTAQATILQNRAADVLHGLPAPEITRRPDEPRRAPEFQ